MGSVPLHQFVMENEYATFLTLVVRQGLQMDDVAFMLHSKRAGRGVMEQIKCMMEWASMEETLNLRNPDWLRRR